MPLRPPSSARGPRPRAGAFAAGGLAHADAWPTKPISLVVPFPAGGTTDVLARSLADKQQSLGQPVIVESKPGAGATLGADHVAKARPDGYTLLVGAVHHTIASSVYRKLPYDFQKSFAPVTTIRARAERARAEPVGDTSDQMAAQVRVETEKFARLVKDAKVTID